MTFEQSSVEYWNSRAEELSDMRKRELGGEAAGLWARTLSETLPKGKPLSILDVGTGSGFLAMILSGLGHRVVGIDLSPVMIQCAYETAAQLSRRVEYRIMDAAALDFPDESFDAVVSLGLVGCLENAPKAYSEWFRTLKSGGVTVCFDRENAAAPLESGDSASRGATPSGSPNRRPAHPQWDLDCLRSCGFAHCRARTVAALSDSSPPDSASSHFASCDSASSHFSPSDSASSHFAPPDSAPGANGMLCITAHKPAQQQRTHIPQLSQFNHYIKTAKKELLLYQNWCQEHGLTHTEYSALHMIAHHSGGARPSDIAGALVIPRQTLTRVLGKLEADGLIRRRANEDDRRSAFIVLTPEGSERFGKLHDALHLLEEKALREFSTDELSQLCGFNDRLLKAFEDAFGQTEED